MGSVGLGAEWQDRRVWVRSGSRGVEGPGIDGNGRSGKDLRGWDRLGGRGAGRGQAGKDQVGQVVEVIGRVPMGLGNGLERYGLGKARRWRRRGRIGREGFGKARSRPDCSGRSGKRRQESSGPGRRGKEGRGRKGNVEERVGSPFFSRKSDACAGHK
jgi:hypothetical protein